MREVGGGVIEVFDSVERYGYRMFEEEFGNALEEVAKEDPGWKLGPGSVLGVLLFRASE